MRLTDLFESTEYNLQAKYDYFNKLLFEGALPRIPLSWKKLKSVGGMVKCKVGVPPGWKPPHPQRVRLGLVDADEGKYLVWETVVMEISNLFQKSEEHLDGIMVHEMIHVWMLKEGKLGEQHGRNFLRKRAELQKLVPFPIPLTEKVETKVLTDETPAKPIGVMLAEDGEGRIIYVIMKPQVAKEMAARLYDIWGDRIKRPNGKAKWAKLLIVTNDAWTLKSLSVSVMSKSKSLIKSKYPKLFPHREVDAPIQSRTMLPSEQTTLLSGLDDAEVLWSEVRA